MYWLPSLGTPHIPHERMQFGKMFHGFFVIAELAAGGIKGRGWPSR